MAATGTVRIWNVADVWPDGTTTGFGVLADWLLNVMFTGVPPGAAGASKVMLPVTFTPPVTVVGLTENAMICGACTETVVVTDGPIADAAVIVAVPLEDATPRTSKVADVEPVCTYTPVGTDAM